MLEALTCMDDLYQFKEYKQILEAVPPLEHTMSDINRIQSVQQGLEDTEIVPGEGPELDSAMSDGDDDDDDDYDDDDDDDLNENFEGTGDTSQPAEGRPAPDEKRWRWDDKKRCDERLEGIKMECDEYEEKLINGVVDITNISPNYSDMFVDQNTIDELERVTSLSLNRPDAFQYGVLSKNKITGALLYGPPGTGKTLLAKGLARQSGFLMLEISSADVFQTLWGEDEKVIRAAFTLARKLSPCILFIDEADAIFGARKNGDKTHVRAMLNQFLLEWDGVASSVDSPFLLLSTNRPFDLDPAVLRRAPVHIHLDIPTIHQRQGILNLLLKDEVLAPDITIPLLAKLTPAYTGSDLKNLCVSVALNCVHSESPDPKTGKYPLRRVLQRRHINQALQVVRATVLTANQAAQLDAFHRRAGG